MSSSAVYTAVNTSAGGEDGAAVVALINEDDESVINANDASLDSSDDDEEYYLPGEVEGGQHHTQPERHFLPSIFPTSSNSHSQSYSSGRAPRSPLLITSVVAVALLLIVAVVAFLYGGLFRSGSGNAVAIGDEAITVPSLQDKTAKPALLTHLASYIDRHYSADMTLDPDKKYLVFTPTDDGLGNKLLPLISSFFLALILDRTWLVHWVGTEAIHNSKVNIEEVFRPPDGMYWSWSDIVARTKTNKPTQVKPGSEIGDQHTLFRTSLCSIAEALSLTCSVVDMQGAGNERPDKTELTCEDWTTQHRNSDNLIVVWGDQYFIPSIQPNPSYRSFIESVFDDDDIFGPLARFLLRPSAQIAPYIDDMQQRFWSDRYVVSMQMRRRERLGLHDNEVDTAVKCAKRLAVEGKKATGKEVTFFVASDDDGLRDRLIGRMQPEGQVVHVANFSVREEQLGVFFAAIDVILLSRGDHIITTPSSTFGYISAGFGSLVPWRVQLSPGTECVQAVNSEPSSHFWHSMVDAPGMCVDLKTFPHLMAQESCCPRW